VYCHRALVAGSAAEVFACRIEHPESENSNRHLFSQALRHRAWHRRAKVELRLVAALAALVARSGQTAVQPLPPYLMNALLDGPATRRRADRALDTLMYDEVRAKSRPADTVTIDGRS